MIKKASPIFIFLSIASILSGCFSQSAPIQPPAATPPQESATAAPLAELIPPPPAEPTTPPTPTPSKTTTPPPPPAAAVTQEISLESGNLFFKPSTITVKVNQPVHVSIANKGGHTFTIQEFGVNLALNSTSSSVTFTPKKTGTFAITCEIPGHKGAGMVGTLVVTK